MAAEIDTSEWTKQEVALERVFDAPRMLVFEAWTTPEHLMRWFAPRGCTVPFCQLEFRPGGVWHYCMRLPDGSNDWIKSVYREIVEPERIVLTSTFVDEEGKLVLRPDRPREILTTVTFAEQDGKTKLTVRQAFTSPVEMRDMTREGWTQTLDRLAEHLAQG